MKRALLALALTLCATAVRADTINTVSGSGTFLTGDNQLVPFSFSFEWNATTKSLVPNTMTSAAPFAFSNENGTAFEWQTPDWVPGYGADAAGMEIQLAPCALYACGPSTDWSVVGSYPASDLDLNYHTIVGNALAVTYYCNGCTLTVTDPPNAMPEPSTAWMLLGIPFLFIRRKSRSQRR